MDMPTSQTLLNIATILVAVILGWTLLKALLKVTFRLVAIGGVALLAVAAIVWVWGALG
jgi:hypothetical protein